MSCQDSGVPCWELGCDSVLRHEGSCIICEDMEANSSCLLSSRCTRNADRGCESWKRVAAIDVDGDAFTAQGIIGENPRDTTIQQLFVSGSYFSPWSIRQNQKRCADVKALAVALKVGESTSKSAENGAWAIMRPPRGMTTCQVHVLGYTELAPRAVPQWYEYFVEGVSVPHRSSCYRTSLGHPQSSPAHHLDHDHSLCYRSLCRRCYTHLDTFCSSLQHGYAFVAI
jgi:hypothetical protein